MHGERVVWLDSEGEQYIIAANVAEFVDAMHLYAGCLWDAMSACQRAPSQPLEKLRERFDADWRQDAIDDARECEGYEDFCLWAASHGRSAPHDIVSRLVALHTETQQLRALCAGTLR
jgi:hypothetical protein